MDFVDRAKKALNVSTNTSMAKILGVTQPVIAGYKQRNSVPLEQCVKIAELTGVDLNWLILGKEANPEQDLPVQEQMLLTGFRALNKAQQAQAFQLILTLADDVDASVGGRQFHGDIGQYNAGDGRIEKQIIKKK